MTSTVAAPTETYDDLLARAFDDRVVAREAVEGQVAG